MARAVNTGPSLIVSRQAEKQEIISWYKSRLADTYPPENPAWEPVKIGPTWQWEPGTGWLLPERTLGWERLAWCGIWLRHKGKPWCYTMEQARFILWYDAITPEAQLEYHSAVLQRLKGWGKDPVGASVGTSAMFAPIIPDGFDANGDPVGREDEDAWVQIVAVSQEQTKNTMKLMPGLISPEARSYYGIQIGKLNVWGMGDTRQMEAVTSSPLALEGGRPTQIIRNETQNWNASNGGHDMAGTMEGNAAKRDIDSPARILDICNAYRPGEESVGEAMRDAWEATQGDLDAETDEERPKFLEFGLLYDSLEASPQAPLSAEAAPQVVESIRGDSIWLDAKGRILKSILNPANPPSESRRKWYNQITATADAWMTPQGWDATTDPDKALEPGEQIVMFLDASKSDDATGLVAARVSDGFVDVLGMWQKPPGARGKDWLVPREAVDQAVREACRTYRVVGFWGDPSHAVEDESGNRYWDALFDSWHRSFGKKFKTWAKPGTKGHAVMFDMALLANQQAFVEGLGQCEAAILDGTLTHSPDPRLRSHVLHARRVPTKAGMSIAKEHRESRRKIDLAVCMVGAWMVRRAYLNSQQRKGGTIW